MTIDPREHCENETQTHVSAAVRAAIMRHGKRIAICSLALFALPFFCRSQDAPGRKADIENSQVSIFLSCGQGCFWGFRAAGSSVPYRFAPPTFEVDGKQISAEVRRFTPVGDPVHLGNGVTNILLKAQLAQDAHLHLGIQFQINDGTPVIRFRYTLKCRSAQVADRETPARTI